MTTLQESLQVLLYAKTPYFSLNSQSLHRLNIFQSWLKIAEEKGYDLESEIVGNQTIDIGCGQGDMVQLFAAALKTQGNDKSRVIGVDPASLDYGSPWTLGQAQSSITAGPLADFLSFKQTNASALVKSQSKETYRVAYFAHSLYYFPSSSVLVETFKSLLDEGVKTLLFAEWALSISRPAALPHLLAVLLQSISPLSDGNIRTVLSPAAYIDAARQAGWKLIGSSKFAPGAELEDGKWETEVARSIANEIGFKTGVLQITGERTPESVRLESLRAHADALEASMVSTPKAAVDGVECMDVWTAVFEAATD